MSRIWSTQCCWPPSHTNFRSWLNLVERWFAELTERWLRRGSHHPRPFVWHQLADKILHSVA
jgi:hypothetical protein